MSDDEGGGGLVGDYAFGGEGREGKSDDDGRRGREGVCASSGEYEGGKPDDEDGAGQALPLVAVFMRSAQIRTRHAS